MARQVTRADILDPAAFEAVRRERRAALLETKKQRRVAVGPHATYYFESYDTMWWQIHEMLRIERGGEAQIPDELEAYNTLIPQGRELVATIMLEIGDPESIELVIDVLSTDAVRIRPGARVLVEDWGGDGALEARVRSVEPSGITKVSALGVEEREELAALHQLEHEQQVRVALP